MDSLAYLVVLTANILGSFNDPFEFDGNYGEELNPIRESVFEQVVSKEAIARHLTDFQLLQSIEIENPTLDQLQHYHEQLINRAVRQDLDHGPTLHELVPAGLIHLLTEKQQALQFEGFTDDDLQKFMAFIERYGDQKVFSFFRHSPSDLLSLDKILNDKATREGSGFGLPILSSKELLKGNNGIELKANLLNALFTKETFASTKNGQILRNTIENLDPQFLGQYFGRGASNQDLMIFTTPVGQTFFYWLYQSLNLHLIAQDTAMIAQVNKVKQVFAKTLGNSAVRAGMFREKLIAANASVVFTQESDAIVPRLLAENGLFHSVELQNGADGTFVFLRSDIWEPNYRVIAIDDYEGFAKGRLNVILATKKQDGEKFLLASSHGNSTRAEDGRLQISKIVEKFNELVKYPENKSLQLVIGIDANTKTESDVKLLQDLLDTLGLESTDVGPTTIKKRMVTTQHSKAGKFAVDEEDYLIILKPENGGSYQMANQTIGFQEEKPDPLLALPNIENPSDHYPVGAKLFKAL